MKSNQLWRAIIELRSLLNAQVKDEDSYQRFFERNPIVFSALGFDAAEPFDKKSTFRLPFDEDRNFTPEPDFICADAASGRITVFELKTPFVPAPLTRRRDGNRRKFRANLQSYVAQTKEYIKSISENAKARSVVRQALKVEKISGYRGVVVYGMIKPEDVSDVVNEAEDLDIPFEIVGFNQILDTMAEKYYWSRNDIESREGWTIQTMIRIRKAQETRKSYLFDSGEEKKNRILF